MSDLPSPRRIRRVPTAIRPPPISRDRPPQLDRCFCTRDLDALGRSLAVEKARDNANGLFCDSTINAGVRRQPSDQLVHMSCPPAGSHAEVLFSKMILSRCFAKYKR